MSKWKAELRSFEGRTIIKLSGALDDSNELLGLESKLHGHLIILDLGGVDRINAAGERDWELWLSHLAQSGKWLVFENCSPAIVSRLNRVKSFAGSAIINSLLAPYYCPSCKKPVMLRLEPRTLLEAGLPIKAPQSKCPECDKGLIFDDVEDSYFAFLDDAADVLEE